MKRFLSALGTLFALTMGSNPAVAESFAQLFNDNAEALKLRLSLLDQAAPGSTVKIATFVFDYGQAVRELTTHACMAVRRGVAVEILADAKSGDRLQVNDAWDSTNDAKSVEEMYNLLADCGVRVFIHNENLHFVTFFGHRLPNIFGVADGSAISPVTLLNKVQNVKARIVALTSPTLKDLGVKSTFSNVLDNVQKLAVAYSDLNGADRNKAVDAGSRMGQAYRGIITDPLWKELNVEKMQTFTEKLWEVLREDDSKGGLGEVFHGLRIFNRLNHRKLFVVRDSKGEGCAIIGGRNLGDHYLTNKDDSFHDGDVLICSDLKNGAGDYLSEVDESFENLKTDTADWALNSTNSQHVREVKAISRYAYQFIKPRELLVQAQTVAMPTGLPLRQVSQPHLLTSNWRPSHDQVRMSLLRAIVQEQRQIWIETAYAEFNKSLRDALEDAMKRGVEVVIVTNGIFISDGPSKMIGLWMAPWEERMKRLYGSKFSLLQATLESGHMIHFKGAAFSCQKSFGNRYYRRYVIGSHNFHPRSGYSDKENALTWVEDTTEACAVKGSVLPTDDLQASRGQYYQKRRKLSPVPLLDIYIRSTPKGEHHFSGLEWELFRAYKMKDNAEAQNLASALDLMFFDLDPKTQNKIFWNAADMQNFVDLIEQGGLRDLVGLIL